MFPYETPIIAFQDAPTIHEVIGRRGGLVVSALDFGSSDPGSGPGRGTLESFSF